MNPKMSADRHPRAYSTQTHLVAMAAILVLPIIIATVFLAVQLYRSQQALFEQRALESARNTTTAIEREIAGMTRTLQVLATSEALRQGDFRGFHRQASEAASVEGIVVVVRDAGSRQLMNTDIAYGDPLPTASRLAESDNRAVAEGRPVVSGFYVALSNGQPSFAVVMPLADAASGARLLSISSSVARMRHILRDENTGDWWAEILDAGGLIITRTREPDTGGQRASQAFWEAASAAPTGIWTGLGADGLPTLTAFQKTAFGWTVAVGAPFATLDNALKELLLYLGSGLTALVAAAITMALVMAQRISEPVVALEGISTRLSRGEPVVQELTRNREANTVGRMLSASSEVLRGRELALLQSQARYRSLFETIDEGFCIVRLIRDDAGKAVDYRFMETNPGFEGHSGLKNAVGRTARELQPGVDQWWIDQYDAVARSGVGQRFEHQSSENGRWYDVHATCISIADAEVAILFEDITDRRKAQERLRISEARFRAVQETSVDGFMVLESIREHGKITDFAWTYANDAAANIVGKPRDWFVGKRLLREMPGNRDEGLFDAYIRVVETGEPWVTELTYRHEGLDIYIRLVAAKADDGFAVTFSDMSVRRRAEEAARNSEARLASALRAGQLGVHEYFVESDVIEWDSVVRRLWGVGDDELINFSVFQNGVHPEDRDRVLELVKAALDPKANGHFAAEYRVVNRQSGEVRWVVAEGQTMFRHGKAERLLGTVRDVTSRKRAEEQRILLINELNHRVKNTLAVVQSIAAQSFKQAPPKMKGMLRLYEERLFALARAHNILTAEHWEGADLRSMLESALAPLLPGGGEDRIALSGPPLRLTARQGVAIAMAAHELATNAIKHGALSAAGGRVCVDWTELDGEVALNWRETGGPDVKEPASKGFGIRLLTRGLSNELDGRVDLCFKKEGVICTITFPRRDAVAPSGVTQD